MIRQGAASPLIAPPLPNGNPIAGQTPIPSLRRSGGQGETKKARQRIYALAGGGKDGDAL